MNMMNLKTSGHLSDDQIDDALIGDLASNAAVHLTACSNCSVRLEEARMPLASFKAVSLAWSERQSATLPVGTMQNGAQPQRLAWGAAVVSAMLAVVIAVPVIERHDHQNEAANAIVVGQQMASVTPVTPAADESAASNQDDEQITRDNEMLNAINQTMDTSSRSPAALGLQPVNARANGRNVTTSVRD